MRTIKNTLYRIRDILKTISQLEERYHTTTSYGMQNSILKSISMKKAQLKSLIKKVGELTNGNILTITFIEETTGDRYIKIYTNISRDDAKLHLNMVDSLYGLKISILEINEVTTQDSWVKL